MDKRQPTDAAHEAIRERLPWYASGMPGGAERTAIAAHLERCAACRAELELERRSAALFRASAPAPRSPEPGLARLLAQIDAAPGARRGTPAALRGASALERFARWVGAAGWPRAVAGAGALALALGISLSGWQEHEPVTPPAPDFHVLGSAPATPAGDASDIHLVLAPATDAARRQALLDAVGARVVAGPNSAGAITVRIGEPVTLGAALAQLRREPEVLLAEPVMPMAMPHIGAEQGP